MCLKVKLYVCVCASVERVTYTRTLHGAWNMEWDVNGNGWKMCSLERQKETQLRSECLRGKDAQIIPKSTSTDCIRYLYASHPCPVQQATRVESVCWSKQSMKKVWTTSAQSFSLSFFFTFLLFNYSRSFGKAEEKKYLNEWKKNNSSKVVALRFQ